MDWKDTRARALWTAAEAGLAALIAFLGALAATWIETGTFTLPFALFVILASGFIAAIAAGLTVLKEYARNRRGVLDE